jgi:hypothetical protein
VGASKREHIGIGIATAGGGLRRFRCAAGFLNLESLVIDHGTVRPAPASVQERFPWARFERSDRSCRLIAQRNRLAGPQGGVLRRVSRPRVGVTLPLGRGNRPCVVHTETCAAAKMEKFAEACDLCSGRRSRCAITQLLVDFPITVLRRSILESDSQTSSTQSTAHNGKPEQG